MVNEVKSLKTLKKVLLLWRETLTLFLGSANPDKFRHAAHSEEKYLELTKKATHTQIPKFDLLVLALERLMKLMP